MNLSRHPELLDRLAAAYALGTLRGPARRRFEQLAREQAPVRAAALLWQGRWMALTELQPLASPDRAVWSRISAQLQAEAALPARQQPAPPAAPGQRLGRSLLAWWQGAAVLGACATVAAAGVGLWSHQALRQSADRQQAALRAQVQTAEAALRAAPQIAYVAVLAGEQAGATLLVTFDERSQTLALQRVGSFSEPADRSLQLWALPRQGAPQSLGVLERGRVLHLAAPAAAIAQAPALAVSLEPLGGVPGAGGPTGPIVFKGAVIRRDT